MRITKLGYNPPSPKGKNNKQNQPVFKGGILVTAKEGKQKFMHITTRGLATEIGGRLKRMIYLETKRRIIYQWDKESDYLIKIYANALDELFKKENTGIRFEFIEDEALDLMFKNLHGHWDLN